MKFVSCTICRNLMDNDEMEICEVCKNKYCNNCCEHMRNLCVTCNTKIIRKKIDKKF